LEKTPHLLETLTNTTAFFRITHKNSDKTWLYLQYSRFFAYNCQLILTLIMYFCAAIAFHGGGKGCNVRFFKTQMVKKI